MNLCNNHAIRLNNYLIILIYMKSWGTSWDTRNKELLDNYFVNIQSGRFSTLYLSI